MAAALPGVIISASASIYAALTQAFRSDADIRLILAFALFDNFIEASTRCGDSCLPIQTDNNAAGCVRFDLKVLRFGCDSAAHWQTSVVEIVHTAAARQLCAIDRRGEVCDNCLAG